MRRLLTALLILCCISAYAQNSSIHSGAKVYIEPAYGYESYLIAAFAAKGVPLVVVDDRKLADYIMVGKVTHKSLLESTTATYTMTDATTSQVVFTYSVTNGHGDSQDKSVAESCASHLKDVIKKQK